MKHPAKYTDKFIPIFAELLVDSKSVLDPFAGTGKLAEIKKHGFKGKVICNELEPEWVQNCEYDVDLFNIGDAQNLSWVDSVEAICTSPTYGNRMADDHNAKDHSRRITYTHYLGRKLNENNTGKMQWGEKYRKVHEKVYEECFRVLIEGGLIIVNVSNHIRNHQEVDVVGFHKEALTKVGFTFKEEIKIETPRMKFGANSNTRVKFESILIFNKGK
jgi:tRNA G10  N-methylase Trm11